MRLFFALWPPEKTARALAQWARGLEGKPVAGESIHLTLAFLGEAEPIGADDAARRVRARRHALPIERARYWKHNRIVWAGPKETPPELSHLVDQLHAALRVASFTLEERPFAAHVSLVRKARPAQPLPPLPAVQWPVNEFLLVRSRTSPEGSAYEPLERYSLS